MPADLRQDCPLLQLHLIFGKGRVSRGMEAIRLVAVL